MATQQCLNPEKTILIRKNEFLSYDVVMPMQMGPIYKAKMKPEKQAIAVDGRQADLAQGTHVISEVKTGKRRIIKFFLSLLLPNNQEAMWER